MAEELAQSPHEYHVDDDTTYDFQENEFEETKRTEKEKHCFFYTWNLQGLTIQQYKNKKKFWNTNTKQDSNLEEILYVSQQGLYA